MITVTWFAEFLKDGKKESITRKFNGQDLDECLRQMKDLVLAKETAGSILSDNGIDKIES